MSEELMSLINSELNEEFKKGVEKGRMRAAIEIAMRMTKADCELGLIVRMTEQPPEMLGKIETLMELVSEGLITTKVAAEQLDISEEVFCKIYES